MNKNIFCHATLTTMFVLFLGLSLQAAAPSDEMPSEKTWPQYCTTCIKKTRGTRMSSAFQ
jgi:hypothetical protein